jgi:hypothetical protein
MYIYIRSPREVVWMASLGLWTVRCVRPLSGNVTFFELARRIAGNNAQIDPVQTIARHTPPCLAKVTKTQKNPSHSLRADATGGKGKCVPAKARASLACELSISSQPTERGSDARASEIFDSSLSKAKVGSTHRNPLHLSLLCPPPQRLSSFKFQLRDQRTLALGRFGCALSGVLSLLRSGVFRTAAHILG